MNGASIASQLAAALKGKKKPHDKAGQKPAKRAAYLAYLKKKGDKDEAAHAKRKIAYTAAEAAGKNSDRPAWLYNVISHRSNEQGVEKRMRKQMQGHPEGSQRRQAYVNYFQNDPPELEHDAWKTEADKHREKRQHKKAKLVSGIEKSQFNRRRTQVMGGDVEPSALSFATKKARLSKTLGKKPRVSKPASVVSAASAPVAPPVSAVPSRPSVSSSADAPKPPPRIPDLDAIERRKDFMRDVINKSSLPPLKRPKSPAAAPRPAKKHKFPTFHQAPPPLVDVPPAPPAAVHVPPAAPAAAPWRSAGQISHDEWYRKNVKKNGKLKKNAKPYPR